MCSAQLFSKKRSMADDLVQTSNICRRDCHALDHWTRLPKSTIAKNTWNPESRTLHQILRNCWTELKLCWTEEDPGLVTILNTHLVISEVGGNRGGLCDKHPEPGITTVTCRANALRFWSMWERTYQIWQPYLPSWQPCVLSTRTQ